MPKLPPAFTLRVMLVVTQIVSALGISALALIQPVLPAPLMSLQPLVGAPQKARADVDLFAIRTALPVANTGTGPFPVVARGTGPADPNYCADASGTDLEVLSNDVVNYEIEYSIGSAPLPLNSVSFTLTLPTHPGNLAVGIPAGTPIADFAASQPAGCTVSTNGQTLTCALGNFSQTANNKMIIPVEVRGSNVNGDQLSSPIGQIKATGVPTRTLDITAGTVNIKTCPSVNLIKGYAPNGTALPFPQPGTNTLPTYGAANGPNGEPGYIFWWPIGVTSMGNTGANGRGGERFGTPNPITPTLSDFSFVDNLVGNTHAVRLVTWPVTFSAVTFGPGFNSVCANYNGAGSPTQVLGWPGDLGNAYSTNPQFVSRGGDCAATQTNGVGPITITLTGVDTSGTHRPTAGYSLASIPSEYTFLSSKELLFWSPATPGQIIPGNPDASISGFNNLTNRVDLITTTAALSLTSVSGQPLTETTTADNQATGQVFLGTQGVLVKSFQACDSPLYPATFKPGFGGTRCADIANILNVNPPEMAQLEQIDADLAFINRGSVPMTGYSCDKIDNLYMQVVGVQQVTPAVAPAPEYGVFNGVNKRWTSNIAGGDQATRLCSDNTNITWYGTITAALTANPGITSPIAMVRSLYTTTNGTDIAVASTGRTANVLQALTADPDTNVPFPACVQRNNWANVQIDGSATYFPSAVIKICARINTLRARVNKFTSPTLVGNQAAGSIIRYALKPTLQDLNTPLSQTVNLYDVLPPGMSLVVTTSNNISYSMNGVTNITTTFPVTVAGVFIGVTPNARMDAQGNISSGPSDVGYTLLQWRFFNVVPNANGGSGADGGLPTIFYLAKIADTVSNGTRLDNVALMSTDYAPVNTLGLSGNSNPTASIANGTTSTNYTCNVAPVSVYPFTNPGLASCARSDLEPVTISNISRLAAAKYVDPPLIEVGNNFDFRLEFSSLNQAAQNPDLIDVFPYIGDGRTPPSTFTGDYGLRAVPVAVTPTMTNARYLYSADASTTINADANCTSNGGPGPDNSLVPGSPQCPAGAVVTTWCDAPVGGVVVYGAGTCPIALGPATQAGGVKAMRLQAIGGQVAQDTLYRITLPMSTTNNAPQQQYSNLFTLRSNPTYIQPLTAVNVSALVDSGRLSGVVYRDDNDDGLKAISEPGILGARVYLTGTTSPQSGAPQTLGFCTFTDASGAYSFAPYGGGTQAAPGAVQVYQSDCTTPIPTATYFGVPAGTWSVVEQAQTQAPLNVYIDGKDTAGTNGGTVSADRIDNIVMPVGSIALNYNFGERLATLGDFMWNDLNANGLQDVGEPGLANVLVTLQTPTGTLTTTTNAAGIYTFSLVLINTPLTLTMAIPAGYAVTQINAGNVLSDSNINPSGAAFITLTGDDSSVDAGMWQFAQLGDRVWIESDTDGLASTGIITPVANMLITATNGVNVYTTTTDAQGYYSLTVPGGTYTVTYQNIQTLYGPLLPGATPGGNTASGNAGSYQQAGDPDQSHAQNTVVTVTTGQANWLIDFAFNTPQPALVLTKYTNGFDADAAPGPSIGPGSPVTWTYVAQNTGNISLAVAAGDLRDDVIGIINLSAFTLMPGQVVTLSQAGLATAGQYVNTGTITGTPAVGPPVTYTNPSHYFGADPSLVLQKLTNGYDASALPLSCNVPGGQPCVRVGDAVTWTYQVTNTGNMIMSIAAGDLSDDVVGAINASAFTLAPATSLVFTVTGIATVGQYTNTGTVTGTPVLLPGTPITPDIPFAPTAPVTNPITSTDPSHYFGDGPDVVVQKYTNGFDADVAPGPVLAVGDVVTWTYVVTNTGNVSLTNLTLSDDVLGTITCPVSGLAPGATTTCTRTGVATPGQYANTAVVTGMPPIGLPVTGTNASHYFGATPGIALRKYTNGYDTAVLGASPQPYIHVGQAVTWTYVVTNTGNVTLTNFTLLDDQEGGVNTNTCAPNPLPNFGPGQITTCTIVGIATAGQYTNTAVVSGTYSVPPQMPELPGFPTLTATLLLTAEYPSHYFGYTPDITLRKYTNGYDAGALGVDAQPYIAVGQAVTWTYIVTNSGDVSLTNFTLVDDQIGIINLLNCAPNPLPNFTPGQVITCAVNGIAALGQYTNTAVVTGTPPAGPPVTSTDQSHYFGTTPGIALRKYTNGYDADALPLSCNGAPTFSNQPCVVVGSAMVWTYIVTNTGNVSLTHFTLVDDKIGGISTSNCAPNPTPDFLPGQVITCTMNGTAQGNFATLGQYTNTAVVTGTYTPPATPPDLPNFPLPATAIQLTDTNASHYTTQANPAIVLRKTTNGVDTNAAGASVQPFIAVGSAVTWTYVVTNTGNVTLTGFSLVDDQIGPLNASNCAPNPLPNFGPGQVVTCTITGVATAGQYLNIGTVTGTPPFGPPVTSTSVSQYFGTAPGIALRKYTNGYDADTLPLGCNGAPTFSNQPCVALGTAIVWTYVVTNTGNVSLTNFTLVDDQLGNIAASNCAPNPTPNFVPGQVVVCTTTGTAAANTATGGQYTNTALVAATFAPPVGLLSRMAGLPAPTVQVTATNPSHYFTTQSAFALTKVVNRTTAQPADTLVYTVTVTNTGNTPLVNAGVADVVPAQLNVASAACVIAGNDSCATPLVTGNLVQTTLTLGVGGVAQLVITGTIQSNVISGTQIINTGVMTVPGQPPATTAPVTTTVVLPVLRLVKMASIGNKPNASVGDIITYTIVVSNVGAGIAYNLVVTDPVPAATSYVAGSAQPAAAFNNNVLSWTLASLLPGQSLTLSLQLRINVVGERATILNVAYADADGNPAPTPGTPAVTANDDAAVPVEPTAVVLTLFTAMWLEDGTGVKVEWVTGSEIKTFGFGLYRSADGTRESAVLVTPELIPSTSTNNGGARYVFDDMTAEPMVTYTYWLQELETTGRLNEYGPVDTNGRRIDVTRVYLPVLMH